MKEVLIHDIIEAPGTCGPFAVRQEGNLLIVLCPWCGTQVGEFDFDGRTFGELTTSVCPQMYEHLNNSLDCDRCRATVKLKFLGRPLILPELQERWTSLGIQI